MAHFNALAPYFVFVCVYECAAGCSKCLTLYNISYYAAVI
jgi:hypothetical protein